MIRVALFGLNGCREGEIQYYELPPSGEGGFRCVPEEVACPSCIRKVAQALRHGAMTGVTCRHTWYRQASTVPAADAAAVP